jgi:hypothetical protein
MVALTQMEGVSVKFALIAVIALALGGVGYAAWPDHDHVHLATCVGADPCKACKTCSACKYCKEKGHSCGVCKDKKK